MFRLANALAKGNAPMGAMDVYFMGVRLFSKKVSNVWPNKTLVAEKCARAYEAYTAGNNIEDMEHVLPVKQDDFVLSPKNQGRYLQTA